MKGVFFAILGLATLIGAVIAAASVQRFRHEAIRTDGVVTRLNAGGSHPQIRFVTRTGDAISYAQGGLIFGYSPGDRVKIMYLPERPQATAMLDRVGAIWAMPMLMGFLGIGSTIGGLLHFIAVRRG